MASTSVIKMVSAHPAKPTKYTVTMYDRIKHGVNATVASRTALLSTKLTLANVKKVSFKFDPFIPSTSCREFMCLAHQIKVRQTNASCRLKPDVTNDRSEPAIEADLIDGRKLKLLTENLTLLDILNAWMQFAGNTAKPN